MIYVSLDIETTGLDPATCDVLEVGAFLEDTDKLLPREQLPTFHRYLWKDIYRGEPYALAMNAHIFKKILELKKSEGVGGMYGYDHTLTDMTHLWGHFKNWVFQNKNMWPEGSFVNAQPTLTVAGKNVAGFDLPFLKNAFMPKFHHRVIDPGMMYFNPRNDKVPPDLKECKKRAKLPEVVTHEALDDAWDVIQLVREKFPII
jgi:oligoribonuclease